MPLDRSKIQARLDALQTKGGKQSSFEKTDFTKIFWKPRLGSQDIRIVPSQFNKDWPFQQVSFHKDITVWSMYSLTNWGELDPIIEFIAEYKKDIAKKKTAGVDVAADYDTLKKLYPKNRTYVQIVVRGEEHLGTRLWEFGKDVEEQILTIMNNKDYGDITDIVDGVDLEISGVNAEFNGTKYVKPTISPRRNSSSLTEDKQLIEKLLNQQHDPLKLYKKFSYTEIFDNLKKWLTPEVAANPTMEVAPPTIDDMPWNDTVVPVEEAPAKEVKKPLTKDKVSTTTPKEAVTNATKKGTNKFSTMFKEKENQ